MNRDIRKTALVALCAIFCGCGWAFAQQQEAEQIVYIDGVRYVVHTVVKNDTLYALSKSYGVSMEDITSSNPVLADGLKIGQSIKIPYNEPEHAHTKRSKKDYTTHVVKQGETLYSISRKYSISVDALLEDNKEVDQAHLPIGTHLYIRRSEIGRTGESESKEEIVKHSKAMNSVIADADYSYHVVHSGESAENIATRFGTTVPDLLTLNRMSKEQEIREGLIIKVPKTPIDALAAQNTADADEDNAKPSLNFKALTPDQSANVTLMLPIVRNGKPAQNYLDFYQGFLLGADRVRREGYSATISLANTETGSAAGNAELIKTILDGDEQTAQADLIIGPVYENELIPVANFAENRPYTAERFGTQGERAIPVVSPLANLTQTNSDAVFQMSPIVDTKYNKVRSLFDGSKRVVFITSESTDEDFAGEVRGILGAIPFSTHHYIYEHPSIIEKRLKEREAGAIVPDSPSDLSPLLDSDRETVFVILAASETEIDRILAALASAKISMTARSRSVAPYVVFGNSKWNRYRNIDRSLFFANNIVMLSTYHVDQSNSVIRDFIGKYVKSFGATPSLYSYRGYDAAVIFIRSLYKGTEELCNDSLAMPLQTPYRFELNQTDAIRLRANQEWVRVNYNSNFTITTE